MALPTFSFTTTAEEGTTVLADKIRGKNVLITGTSLNGIGFETPRVMAKRVDILPAGPSMPGKAKYLREKRELGLATVPVANMAVSSHSRLITARVVTGYSCTRVSAQGNGSTSPSNISFDARMDASITDPISDNVFSAISPSPAGNLPSGHFYVPYGSYFYQNTHPEVPVGAPAQSYHEFKLQPPRPTVEEVPDEDDRSYLATRHQNISTDSVESLDSVVDSVESGK
ncbi:hypothetical protein B0H14DRAFT_2576857 [Mycena olivaceomarginata]|nr:hypothetical protein B0H14DRAFT_2576857 [Mycena olivaceomarginata]